MNNTIATLLELENELSKLETKCEVKATITCENDQELKDAAQYLNRHVYEPYQLFENETYLFEYRSDRHPGITITVKSKQHYRRAQRLIEI